MAEWTRWERERIEELVAEGAPAWGPPGRLPHRTGSSTPRFVKSSFVIACSGTCVMTSFCLPVYLAALRPYVRSTVAAARSNKLRSFRRVPLTPTTLR
jgi:hypothetical protein